MKLQLIIVLLLFPFIYITAQTTLATDPEFTRFEGNIYHIPNKKVKLGYGEHVYDYTQIGEVSWEKIQFEDRDYLEGYPGIRKTTLFGIVLHAEMTIEDDACYLFKLGSDDGSQFWIDDQSIIDNGGDHRYIEKTDTVRLNKGQYPIKIWYFQAYPNRMGFTFSAEHAGYDCEAEVFTKKKPKIADNDPKTAPAESIVLSSSILFATNEYNIRQENIPELDSLCEHLKSKTPRIIRITGHTDHVGSDQHNQSLSLKRAEAIRNYMMKKMQTPGIPFSVSGQGENQPIASNETEAGRQENRRVEIQWE